ncbi:MAG: O-antigen ligase family protein [Bacteroidales bacterium]
MAQAKNSRKANNRSNSMMAYFLAGAVGIVIPVLHFQTTIDPVLYPRFLGWSILCLILLLSFWVSRSKIHFQLNGFYNGYFISLGAFILVSILSLVLAYNPIEGLTDLMKWILVWIFSAIVLQILFLDKNALNILIKGMILFAFLISLVGIYEYFTKTLDNPDPNAIYEVKGLMGHKNQYSFSLLLVLPFLASSIILLNGVWRNAGIVATFIVLIMISLLQTRAVWIAMGLSTFLVGFTLWISHKKNSLFKLQRKWIVRFGAAIVNIILFIVSISFLFPDYNPVKKVTSRVSTIFDPEFTSNQWRIEIWDATFRLAKDNPVVGVGGGNWKISIYPYYGRYLPSVFKHWRNPHNDYLGILSEKDF